MNEKKIVVTPDKFEIFRRALSHLVEDLINNQRKFQNNNGISGNEVIPNE